ncbi:MAG TPA: hypothetical protein VH083_11240 [Myxococcales bacterium]|nr:hypothetical protein [Myxococcales bacterium]
MGLSLFGLAGDPAKSELELLRRSRFTVIAFSLDRETCVVNEMAGGRGDEAPAEQDRTAVDVPCANMFGAFEMLRSLPAKDAQTILDLIPPVQPAHPITAIIGG